MSAAEKLAALREAIYALVRACRPEPDHSCSLCGAVLSQLHRLDCPVMIAIDAVDPFLAALSPQENDQPPSVREIAQTAGIPLPPRGAHQNEIDFLTRKGPQEAE